MRFGIMPFNLLTAASMYNTALEYIPTTAALMESSELLTSMTAFDFSYVPVVFNGTFPERLDDVELFGPEDHKYFARTWENSLEVAKVCSFVCIDKII